MRLLQDLGPRQVAFGATLARCRSIASGGQFKQGGLHDGDDPDASVAPLRARRRRGRGAPAQHCSIHSARHRRPGSSPHARPAAHRAGARTGPARHPAPAHLLGRGRHELARVPVQPAPDHASCLRLCGLHDLRGGPRRPRAARHAARGRLRLGAIVAPADVVAPLAIARRLGLPRGIVVVLEGEGLANDATALILYRFAVAAISTGMFSLPIAAGEFATIIAGEMLFGAAVGWLSLRVRHRARDPQIEITLSLITPYLAYWVPEHFGGSGVISTVACGLYISWNGPLLISSATRLQGIFFWDLVIYLIEGMLFLLTGFQMRSLFERSKAFSLDEILLAIALVAGMIIIARFAWVFPATYLPRLIKRLRIRDPSPPWPWVFVLAFTGVRGAVSLAAALAL